MSARSGGAGHQGRRGEIVLTELAKTRLGLHLRAMYDAVVQEPVPDRFRDLIDRLDSTPSPAPGVSPQPSKERD